MFFICFYLLAPASDAQIVRRPAAATYAVLDAYSIMHTNAFDVLGNPAAVARINNFTAGVYGEKRFLLEALSLFRAAMIMPVKNGSFALSGNYFGNALHNESNIGFTYGRKLAEKIFVGAEFSYISLKQQGYGLSSTLTAGGGILFKATDQLTAGLHVYNPARVRFGKGEERLPSMYNMGLCFEPSDKFYLALQVSKVEDEAAVLQSGLTYYFDKKLSGKIGFETGSSLYYLGFGVQLGQLRLETIASVHPHLGLTPGLQLSFERKNAKHEKN